MKIGDSDWTPMRVSRCTRHLTADKSIRSPRRVATISLIPLAAIIKGPNGLVVVPGHPEKDSTPRATGLGAGMTVAPDEMAGGRGGDGLPARSPIARMKVSFGQHHGPRAGKWHSDGVAKGLADVRDPDRILAKAHDGRGPEFIGEITTYR